MNRKALYLIAAAMLVSSVVPADILFTTYINADTGYISRYDDNMNLIWQSTNQRSIHRFVISPLNGNIYAGFDGTDKLVKQFDVNTGALIGITVPTISGLGSNHINNLTFGYDWNGDGVLDLWIVTRDSLLVFNGAGTLGSGATSELARWAIPNTDNYNGTGGSGIMFGPDITGDGIPELYVGKGQDNNALGRINVFNVAASGVGNENLVRVASYPAGSTRDHEALILGPDFNGDGFLNLMTVSSRTHAFRAYNFTVGTDLGAITHNLSAPFYPLGITVLPNGSLVFGTRFKSSLDPAWTSGEQQGGNLIRLDRIPGSNPPAYTPTLLLLAPQAGDFRFNFVAYLESKAAYAPVPAPGKKVTLDLDQISWTLPEPNEVGGTITCDVWFSEDYPDYLPFADPNLLKLTDPNDRASWWLENRSFSDYATKVITNQSVNTLDLSAITTLPLTFGQTYYWRVDTRDSSNPEAGTTIGKVWKFTADNSAPQVDAGSTVYTYLTEGTVDVQMTPTVTDDGRPDPPAAYTVLWTLQSGQAENVTINNPATETTTITFTATGTYVFLLTVDDSELTNADTVTVNVYADACLAAKGVPEYARALGDINDDCNVDMTDLGLLAADWLDSTALD